jgi:hypothetical protein
MTKRAHILPVDAHSATPPRKFKGKLIIALAALTSLQLYLISLSFPTLFRRTSQLPLHAERSLARCASLKITAGPPANFHDRSESDRFVAGTKATLVHNARIWTGENNGTKILRGDVFIDKGIIQGVGNINFRALGLNVDDMVARGQLNVVDAHGAWVTPGWVSMSGYARATHPAIFSTGLWTRIRISAMPRLLHLMAPSMTTPSRVQSNPGFAPWMDLTRTTTLMPCPLPAVLQLLLYSPDQRTQLVGPGICRMQGLAEAFVKGGQAFTIKLRMTAERSPTSMLLEPPRGINGTYHESTGDHLPWRQMK